MYPQCSAACKISLDYCWKHHFILLNTILSHWKFCWSPWTDRLFLCYKIAVIWTCWDTAMSEEGREPGRVNEARGLGQLRSGTSWALRVVVSFAHGLWLDSSAQTEFCWLHRLLQRDWGLWNKRRRQVHFSVVESRSKAVVKQPGRYVVT